jgi:predicted double-glycine peptidase
LLLPYTCGAAALATVMKQLGVNATEEKLARLAGTDETSTTMWGLARAAAYKELNAKGFVINDTSQLVNQLKPDYIIVLQIKGVYHYNIIEI